MSLLINNDLIWVSIPRCASVSIENSFLNNNILEIKHVNNIETIKKIIETEGKEPTHYHYRVSELYKHFGYKETVCITRDWFERWLSSFNRIMFEIKNERLTPIVGLDEFNNELIYKIFDDEFSNDLYNGDFYKCYSKLTKETITEIKENSLNFGIVGILQSQNYFKDNLKCTYEFDIKNIEDFKKFIEKRYNIEFNLPMMNLNEKIDNNIVVNDELKEWIWNKFELPFEKKKKLI